jgi:DNA primase
MDLSSVDVADFLSSLQIRNVSDEGEEFRFSCPFPGHANGDETASAYMNRESTAFYCHGCKAQGNAVHFLAKLDGLSPLMAARFIRQRYGQGFMEPDGGLVRELEAIWTPEEQPLQGTNQPIKYQMDPLPEGPLNYLLQRGFTEATLEAWEIGYDKISDRIAIPIRNENGELIGFKGRAWRPDHQPKYLVLGDRPNKPARYGFPTYEVSRVVFGLHAAMTKYDPGHTRTLVIVEGELNVLAIFQASLVSHVENAAYPVAVGSNFSGTQCRLVLSWADEVVVYTDNDPAGHAAGAKLVEQLGGYVPCRIAFAPPGEDPAEHLPSDRSVIIISEAKSVADLWLPDV